MKPRSLNAAQRDLYLRVAASRDMDDPAYTEDYPLDRPDAPPPAPSTQPNPVRPDHAEGLAALTPADRRINRLAAAWLFLGASVAAFLVSIALTR
ncbi:MULTISPECIES: hypothetical protein [unclassified Novosphingobium]|uniref:hypothetical protein n=1 Tax=unclassified Novosphingobium TaxID=2644732 RepID=UPI000D311DAD|nr:MULTISPECIES: hypothetical protein [unclassified Novosphingobium]PTR07897.1 hypothetical protein C8K11_113108 [Novosphingobium sp. GV055]PUB00710.1 hypothetical protein C8K12_113108 [Novosphingobium sp. GV061]PUB16119.1 hypothetical protein C8K14_113108 [Novosphingobium sp. GV079]PUB39584.1 hypothetical protein C8K10_113108 [Novosphingobium sp. GV027]